MADLRPTITEFDTMSCCLDWAAPFEIAERRHARGAYSSNVSIILGKLMSKGWIQFGRPNGTYRVTDKGKKAMRLPVGSVPDKVTAREGLINLLAATDPSCISRFDPEAKGLMDHFKAALAGGLIRHAGYVTTEAGDDWLNSEEGIAALDAAGLHNDH